MTESCEHEWKPTDNAMYENEVRCTKCGVYGERESDGSVYWPAT